MNINPLKTKLLEVWLPFGDGAEVLIAHTSREDLLAIAREAQKISIRKGQEVKEYDPVKADKLLGRKAVKDWKGFDDDGKEFPCTPENIDLLMMQWTDFARFVNDACGDLERLVRQKEVSLSKNSSNTSGPG